MPVKKSAKKKVAPKKSTTKKAVTRKRTYASRKAAVAAVEAFVLLDRSGSMSDKWHETLASVNQYVQSLGKDKAVKAKVTLAAFDHSGGLRYEVVRSRQTPAAWEQVTSSDVLPGGYTPLYDAIGRVVAAAKATGEKRTVIVVTTDGQENASTEVTQAKAKALLAGCKADGWQVVFLGADFDAFGQAASVGIGVGATLSNIQPMSMRHTMATFANYTSAYGASGAGIAFTAADRAAASAQPANDNRAKARVTPRAA